MKTISLINAIERALYYARESGISSYFVVEDVNEENVKIRIADHQGKKINNKGTRTISFITDNKIEGGFGYGSIQEEYLMDEDNYTDTYQTVEQVLEWADIDYNTKDYMQVR